MIRSLYSGASGMKNHQIRMDVIGNNVANVNTIGFKGSRANFQDVLYQTVRYASPAVDETGGINPSQVGLGVMVSSITNNTGQGGLQNTGRVLDVAVNGNGWFVVSPDSGGEQRFYTREGIFYVDNVGNLVNSNGFFVLDSGGAAINLGEEGIATLNITKGGVITGVNLNGDTIEGDGSVLGLAMFPNQDGLERVGQNMYQVSPTSGEPIDEYGTPNEGGYGAIASGFLEMSNVDLTDEFTGMITTQRGYQANARTVTTSDHLLEELLNIKR